MNSRLIRTATDDVLVPGLETGVAAIESRGPDA